MPGLLVGIASLAALGMTAAFAATVGRAGRGIALVGIAGGVASMATGAGLAAAIGGTSPLIASAIATGSAPATAFLYAVLRREERATAPALTAALIWAIVVVPAAIVAPQAIASACPPQACVVEDFAGALPFAVGVGAFVLVPSAAIPSRTVHPARGVGRRGLLVLVVWAAFVVWLAALELDVDRYTPVIAAAAVLAPATAAAGWALTDRIRGLDVTTPRGLALGLIAGMVAILPSAVSVTTPWAPLIGAVAGIAGALAHDARALRSAPESTRAGVAAVVVGTIGMIVPGILGTTLGFVFAARVDVLGSQSIAVIGTAVLAVAVSVPAAILLRRRAGG